MYCGQCGQKLKLDMDSEGEIIHSERKVTKGGIPRVQQIFNVPFVVCCGKIAMTTVTIEYKPVI